MVQTKLESGKRPHMLKTRLQFGLQTKLESGKRPHMLKTTRAAVGVSAAVNSVLKRAAVNGETQPQHMV